MFRKLRYQILDRIQGKYRFQDFFTKLYYISLVGMNIGPAGNIQDGGEVCVLEYIKRYIAEKYPNEEITIFDIGANNGNYSLAIMQTFQDHINLVIHAFEPSPIVFPVLKNNLKLFKNIKLHNIGFSNTEEEAVLFTDLNSTDCASLYHQDLNRYGVNLQPLETVRLKTIDQFCLELGINKIHLLKMDIEGHEIKALEGAKSLLDSDTPPVFIQFEFGRPNIASRTFLKDFFALLCPKYDIYRVVKDGLWAIPTYNEVFELFGTTNYIAKLK